MFVYGFNNVCFKSTNVVSCNELNEPNEVGYNEVDDYEEESEEQEYVAEEFWQFKNYHKPNLEETKISEFGRSRMCQ